MSASVADEIDETRRRLQQAEQSTEAGRQSEAQVASLQGQVASLQEECSAKGSQVQTPLFDTLLLQ